MTDASELLRLAGELSDAQRRQLLSFRQEPRQMGIGMTHWLPGLVERDGINHPCFGSHHRLTPLGIEVAASLRAIASTQEQVG